MLVGNLPNIDLDENKDLQMYYHIQCSLLILSSSIYKVPDTVHILS